MDINTELPGLTSSYPSNDEILESLAKAMSSKPPKSHSFDFTKSSDNRSYDQLDATLLNKTLKVLNDSLNQSSLDKAETKEIASSIREFIKDYKKTGELNLSSLSNLVDNVSSRTDTDMVELSNMINSVIDSELVDTIQESLSGVVINASGLELDSVQARDLLQGTISINELIGSSDLNIDELLKSSVIKESFINMAKSTSNGLDSARYDDLKSKYLAGEISATTLANSLSALVENNSNDFKELETVLKSIERNTDPETGKLTHAEEIKANQRTRLQDDNAKDLAEVLDRMDSFDPSEDNNNLLDRIDSARSAGYETTNSLLDAVFGSSDDISDLTDIADTDSRRSSRRGSKRSGGKFSKLGGLLNKSKGLLSAGIKKAPLIGAAASAGMGVFDYFDSDNTKERTEAVSSAVGGGLGSIIGGGVGALLGPPGVVIGSILGGMLGNKTSEWMSGWFTDITDTIPDSITKKGPISELNYIESRLKPQVLLDIESGNGTFDKDDLNDLNEYTDKLIDKSIPSFIESQLSKYSKGSKKYNELVKSYDHQLSNVYKSNDEVYNKLGGISSKYESGSLDVNAISSGIGDAGGVSYGTYQLASNTGTMQDFLDSPEGALFKDQFNGSIPGSKEFNSLYSAIAGSNGKLLDQAQHDFIKRTHYEPVLQYAKDSGLDTSNKAIQEALWSQAVQHSQKGNKTILDSMISSGVDLSNSNAVLSALYNSRGAYASKYAGSSATTDRYDNELQDVLALNGHDMLTDSQTDEIDNLLSQGGIPLPQLSLVTGASEASIRRYLSSKSKSRAGHDDFRVASIDTNPVEQKSESTNNPQAPIVITQSAPSQEPDIFRMNDDSLLITSFIG